MKFYLKVFTEVYRFSIFSIVKFITAFITQLCENNRPIIWKGTNNKSCSIPSRQCYDIMDFFKAIPETGAKMSNGQ